MLSFHSIAPVRLTQATEKRPPPKPKPPTAMTDTQVASHGAVPGATDANGPAHVKDFKTEREPGSVVPEGQRDSGIDLSHDEAEAHQDTANHENHSHTTSTLSPPTEESHTMADAQEEHHEASQPVFSSQEVTDTADNDTEAGPSRDQAPPNNTPPPGDNALVRPVPHRGESTVNAVGYRRNSETVIAFLVPLPKPTIQGSTLDIPAKYFLYVPPAPPLVKPKRGKEPYARRAHRVWQHNVRKAKANAHNGKRVSLSALHSATIRGCLWASEKRKGTDDGAVFLGRIQPETVAHLVMIHPWALSTDQTPEEILKTFRAQITANKASSIVKILTRKMGPEPKTLQVSPKAIIDDTRGPRESESSEEEEVVVGVTESEQPQASRKEKLRASFDSAKLRNSVAAIKSQIQQRGRKRHRDGSPSAAAPDTPENVEPDANLTEGELEHHSEEEAPGAAGLVDAEGEPFTGHQLGEIPEEGFLEHFEETVEETPDASVGQAGGGLFAGSLDAGNVAENDSHAKKGSRFQLTFYPSPAMDIMSRYVQESCHTANGHAFPSPAAVPTAAGVLASIGWEPERRVPGDADEQMEDENWQARETEEDLEAITAKAARAWEKQCRKYVRQSKGGRLSGDKKSGRFAILVARVRPQKPAKGKQTEGQPEASPAEKKGKAAALKQRLAAIKDKRSGKPQTEEAEPTEKQSKKEKAQKAAGIILFPVIVILGIPILIGKGIASGFKKVKDRKTKTDEDAEGTQQQEAKTSRRAAMKHRLSERSGSVKQGLSTRREAIKKRLAERKANKTDANAANDPTPPTAASHDGQEVDAAVEAHDPAAAAGDPTAAQAGLTKKQRLTSFLVAGPLAINHMIEKRRRGTDQATATTTEDATPKDKKASRLAGAKERVKALRTRVNKEARFAKLKARSRALQERRQNRKNVKKSARSNGDTETASQIDSGNNETSVVKRHSAIAGLAAACVALPAAKIKQARDKRRKDMAAESVEGAAAAARGEHVTANNPSVAEAQESASPPSRASGVRLVPSDPEMLEPAVDSFRPPENGQSEVPVQQAARTEPEALPEASSGDAGSPAVATAAAAATASDGDKDNAGRSAAAVKFQSIRDGLGNARAGIGSGITNFAARRRATGQNEAPVDEETQRPQAETMDSAETRVEANAPTREPNAQPAPAPQDTAASGGRFKSIKDGIGSGIEGLKAKRQREKEPRPQGGETTATAADAKKDTASPGARIKALKDGIGARRAKAGESDASAPVKTEKSKQEKQHTQKESNSGIVDRVRWFLYAA
ncbi:hypothetical protein KVR01_003261 [Diaporthe batatas]|uniref:uncharacterized protein n=1 Tax=Diaporthe batatas TaxID=748121 RepID=UPI001D059DB2|nr:uncharacterized protein KVR01_003261 [Diaporthe batatas]KAG8167572.1 hypothetical protein KVR01_003261 [Diaporthe batatas]